MFDANKLADGKWHVILMDGEGETVIASAINEVVAKDTAAALNFYHYYVIHPMGRLPADEQKQPDGYRVHPADQKRWDVV